MGNGVKEIRVKAKTDVQKLAASITAAHEDGKKVRISAIGPFPVGQAFKAVVIANRTLSSRGVLLGILPGMEHRPIPDRETGKLIPWVVCTFSLYDILKDAAK